jgi:hypothetical protein
MSLPFQEAVTHNPEAKKASILGSISCGAASKTEISMENNPTVAR